MNSQLLSFFSSIQSAYSIYSVSQPHSEENEINSLTLCSDSLTGSFVFPSGSIYTGQFVDGIFSGSGTLRFSQGGTFTGNWTNGKLNTGGYAFKDKLEYKEEEWEYLEKDKRFWSEMQNNVPIEIADQSGMGMIVSQKIPAGCFDLLDGYFDPKQQQIFKYDGEYARTPSQDEVQFIELHAPLNDTEANLINHFWKVKELIKQKE